MNAAPARATNDPMRFSKRASFSVAAILAVSGCTVRRADPALPDSGVEVADAARPDAWRPDAFTTFQCDPLETGVFVFGNFIEGTAARRVLGRFDPATNTYAELADIGSCIEGWRVRAMTVSRDGVVYLMLGNQTLVTYDIDTRACAVHAQARSDVDGFYNLTTFVGNGSGSSSPLDDQLLVTFSPWSGAGPEVLIDVDRRTFAETTRVLIPTARAGLIALVGTQEGRLYASRFNVGGVVGQQDIVEIDPGTGETTSIATTPTTHDVWFRTAVAFWDHRVFLFDAFDDAGVVTSETLEVDLHGGTWSAPLLTMPNFEMEAVSTTTCVGVILI